MLLSEFANVKWHGRNKKHYISKGYKFTKMKDSFLVKVEDLTKGSHALVNVKCDCEDCENPYLENIIFNSYIKTIQKYGKYYCKNCTLKLFGYENMRQTKLKNGKSFAQWCIENNRQDVLDRWDYELNKCKPSEIGFSPEGKFYFKCPKRLHKSQLYYIKDYVRGKSSLLCKTCNSLGFLLPEVLKVWSDKNKKSPFEYTLNSTKEVYWKCPEGKHEDYKRDIHSSKRYNFRCPECDYSKGEEKIYSFLINMGFIKISQEEFEQLIDEHKYNKSHFIPQMKFDGLVGLKGGLLSYDFYLPTYNLLIEYQGEYHDGTVPNQTKKDFEKQQEHDKRKREYAQKHNISLLEIWYWNFDNIEEILDNYLTNLTNPKEASNL